jgi:methionyl-tRNA synthetase
MNIHTYLTTAIPYVNAAPHLGFALELVQADATARRHRAAGRSVRFQTGTDENAFKNVEAARAAGVSPQAWVDARSDQFRQLAGRLGVHCDRFLRTTEDAHVRGVRLFWRSLRRDDILRKSYSGSYCPGCEDFLFAKDLVEGRCPDHQTAPIEVAETNYFFRLSAYQEPLERWLASGTVTIRPEWRRAEILAFVRAGLQDISISRPAERTGGWGVRVPDDDSHVVYVWIDALINYLTGLGYGAGESWQEGWNAGTRKIHVVGKNVWKFHAVYWPALLLSAGLPLPDELAIHGFLTVNGRKISKSLGNTIDPDFLFDRYGPEAVRYFLLRAIPQFGDGDFSTARFAAVYEADLANGLGNLTSRLLTLAERCGLNFLADDPASPPPASDLNQPHDEVLAAIWQQIDGLNRQLEQARPWVALRSGPTPELRTQLAAWLNQLRQIAAALAPFLPQTSQQLGLLLNARPLSSPPPLFPRV